MTAQWAVRAAKDQGRDACEASLTKILSYFLQHALCIFSFPRVLRRLENIVASRAAKAASDAPYFLRALHEKQLSTVFPSLTLQKSCEASSLHKKRHRDGAFSLFSYIFRLFPNYQNFLKSGFSIRQRASR